MNFIPRFEPDWTRISVALLNLKLTEDETPFGDPRENFDVYEGPFESRRLILSGRMKSTGAIEFRNGTTGLYESEISIFETQTGWEHFLENRLPWSAETITDEHWIRAFEGVAYAFRSLCRDFDEHIYDGRMDIAGRVGSPIAEITVLSPDAWHFLEVVDWKRGLVLGPEGLKIYGVHVKLEPDESYSVVNVKRDSGVKRSAVTRLFQGLDRGSLEAMSAKELFRYIKPNWEKYYPHIIPPKDDTLRRARDELIASWPAEKDA